MIDILAAVDSEREQQIIAKCQELGIEQVRHLLAIGRMAGDKARVAQAWLDGEDRLLAESATAAQDELARSHAAAARDAAEASRLTAEAAEEANQIARDANAKAQTANTIATLALIAAIIAIGVTAFDAFLG